MCALSQVGSHSCKIHYSVSNSLHSKSSSSHFPSKCLFFLLFMVSPSLLLSFTFGLEALKNLEKTIQFERLHNNLLKVSLKKVSNYIDCKKQRWHCMNSFDLNVKCLCHRGLYVFICMSELQKCTCIQCSALHNHAHMTSSQLSKICILIFLHINHYSSIAL